MLTPESIVAKVTVIAAAGLLASWVARRNRAAIRHAVLAAALGATLLLPVAAMLMPPVRVGVPVGIKQATLLPPIIVVDPSPSVAAAGDFATPAEHGRAISLTNLLLAVWAAGLALFLVPAAVGLWQIRSLRRSASHSPRAQPLVDSLSRGAGIRRRVEVLVHEAAPGPMACGIARPAILMPKDAEFWNADDLNRAILHELEHVRRRDSISLCVARLACAAYWFHPLIWIASRRLALEAERSCDDAVLPHSEATAYADQLVDLAKRLSKAKRLPALAMASRLDLAARVNAVLDTRRERGRAGARALILVGTIAFLLLAVMSPLTLIAAPQAASGGLRFEVASIRPISPETGAGAAVTTGLRIDGAQLHASAPLRALIGVAWKASPWRFEAPEWMATRWYEIAATLPAGHANADEVREMLQVLLSERFHMKSHRETKDLPVYALMLAKGGITAKEDPLDPIGRSSETVSTSSETATVSRLQRGSTLAIAGDRVEAKKFTISMLADQLTHFVDRPVVDRTGLAAGDAWDFTLQLTHEDFLASRVRGALASGFTPPPEALKLLESSGDSVRSALAGIGLRLEPGSAQMEVLVIDSADKTPSDN
jgi:uncharacterized protein (TIGR03435 family)